MVGRYEIRSKVSSPPIGRDLTHSFDLQVMAGNTNTYVAEKRELDPVLIARKLRFFPYSHHRRTVCMRVEIYGCPW